MSYDGNSPILQRKRGEYHDYADRRCQSYYAAVKSGAITLQQAIYALTDDLRKEWKRINGRSQG